MADGAYSVLANDDQRNGDSLDAQMAQPPQHGTLELHPDGTFKYVHNGGLDTEDLFTYFVRDSSGARGEATVVISIFRVLGFQQSTNDLRFTFSTQAGVDYEVDANSTSPAPGAPWQSLTGRFPGVTGVMQMVDPDHSPKYYRVICHSGSGDLLSDPIGHGDLHLKTGWNAINNPFHPFPIFVGTVTAVTEDTLTVAGPGWTPQEFEPQDGFPQFVVMVPWAVPNSRAQPGDWWPILGNGGNTLQVDTRGQHLNSGLAVGDAIELRRLNSFSQLFGTGDEAGSVTPDIPHDGSLALVFNDFESHLAVSFRSTAPDVVSCFYTLNGTDYGPLDGSTISVLPGCGVYYHRVAEPVTRPIFGRVQTFPLTHYAVNTVRQVGSPFPVPAPVATSGLLEAGWVSQTAAGSLDRDEIQVINPGGTNLSIIHRAIPGTPTGWYVNGVLDNTVAFEPGRSQWLRLVARPSPFIWNEHVPWEP